MGDPERWLLTIREDQHLVEILHAALGRRITWSVAGAEVATRRTSEERVVLDGGSRGALSVRLPRLMGPARRVTWYSPGSELGALAAAHAGIGGVDLDPEPGSRAAAREAWIREHPRQYAARRAGAAAAGALAAVLGVWLLSRIHIPWPDWHLRIPWPHIDWPDVPWPDIAIPWPDWQLPSLPEWLRELMARLKYVWPVLLAAGLAHAEVRRRRQQDAQKARGTVDLTAEPDAHDARALESDPRQGGTPSEQES